MFHIHLQTTQQHIPLPLSQYFASCKTIALFFPPNSIKHGFKFSPHTLAMIRPTFALPVKSICFTLGCSIITFVTAAASVAGQDMMFKTPEGMPASWKALPIAQ
jgi:hypothetical protein